MAPQRLVTVEQLLRSAVPDDAARLRAEAFLRSSTDARAYHASACSLHDAGAAASVVFNVASLAAERYLVALCDHHGTPPPGCTLTELVDEVDRLVRLDTELVAQLRAADAFYDICSLETRLGVPQAAEATGMLSACRRLAGLVEAVADARS